MPPEEARNDNTDNNTDDSTLNSALASAWDEVENVESDDGNSEATQSATAPAANTEPPTPTDDSDASAAGGETPPATANDAQPPAGATDTPPGTPAATDDADTPPVGLSATAREVWKDTPKAMRDEIAKREKDFMVGIQKFSANAKRAEDMDRVLAPYQQYFALNGGPGPALQNLLQTGALLQSGAPLQKAQAVAQIINQFGIDIKTLDGLLVGETPPGAQQQSDIERALDQRLGPINQFMQQQQQGQQMQQQQAAQQIQQEIADFAADPKNEFYRDVRSVMADLMEMADRRGQKLTMADAYAQACQLTPEVKRILDARAAEAAIPGKREAAASVSGAPGGPGAEPAAPESIRGAIEEAWDTYGTI